MPGAEVPYLGLPHPHSSSAVRGPAPVWTEEGAILVSGRLEHAPRRLTGFLQAAGARCCSRRARMEYAARLGARPPRITVRDTKSRWGSCGSAVRCLFPGG